ncbi:MAG TPA: class I SAM-dependent DNA methyltransferase [Anaerolineales bacterium]|nr:class I SAM-dependent DNA methyltransferase [Anaerolineales bacterium]HLO28290.1 class I SAM-dependent DNA methyltransferase [Anaerolineales bacterium]
MTDRLSQAELESYLWGAAIILRGLVDAGDYKQYIFPLLFYKRLSDVWDADYAEAFDETQDSEYAEQMANERFVIPPRAHWKDVREQAKDVGKAIQTAFRVIEAANPDKLDGIFGDAPWTNKERLPDHTLKNLLEHFSKHTLSLTNVPEDELGNGYEFLIKKFADDSGHTAQEFYTNRTVVHLMVQMLEPKAGERIYDPTCGTGGMLISALDEVKRKGGEYRTLKLYGQERNHMTASIARMNLVLHGVDDFAIARGDTLERPAFTNQNGSLATFDVVLANPPYSIKQWNREAWSSDPWGRNFLGTPPQGRADYAFFQHILKSLGSDLTPRPPSLPGKGEHNGRCAILFPHGVLFRNEEADMRQKLVDADLLDAVIGLGPNLFYNSPMEACVVVCRKDKPAKRRGKVIFIDALNEVTRERSMSYLRPEHQDHIANAYHDFKDIESFAKVASVDEILANDSNLSIPLYVRGKMLQEGKAEYAADGLKGVVKAWERSSTELQQSLGALLQTLEKDQG